MADFLTFNQGLNQILDAGIPTSGEVEFALSTRDCNTHKATDTYAGGFGEITGTGYARQKQTPPSAASQKKSFSQVEWKTEAHTDWSNAVKSVVLIKNEKIYMAWNLREGGTARDLSGANTTEQYTPTYTLT